MFICKGACLFATIVVFYACINNTGFNRNISFNSNWNNVNEQQNPGNGSVLSKSFDMKLRKDKVYLLQFSPDEEIIKLLLNNQFIQGYKTGRKTTNYNITGQLRPQNSVVVYFGKNSHNHSIPNVRLHEVNKIFINNIQFNSDSNNFLKVEVRIKNTFNTEKQGILRYSVFAGKNQIVKNKETPVFVDGNTENQVSVPVSIYNSEIDLQNAKVICELTVDGKIMDSLTWDSTN